MANQAYNGQPINIQFDYEGEGTMDSKLVQLSESAAKNPTTWLKNGIYRIGNGQPVFTQDGKALIYIGRNGNATDIADDTKWVRLAAASEVSGSLSGLVNPLQFKGSIRELPLNCNVGDIFIATSRIYLTQDNYGGDDFFTVSDYDEYNDEYKLAVSPNDWIICNATGKFMAIQNNINDEHLLHASGVGDITDVVPVFDETWIHRGSYNVKDIGLIASKLLAIQEEFFGGIVSPINLPNNPAAASVANMVKIFRQNGNSFSGSSLTSVAAVVENTFVAAVKALRAQNDTKPIEFILAITAGTANNFFGFVKSQPNIHAVYEVGGASGSGIHDVIHFKNYDLEGTISSPCVEYTYDLDTKVLSYQKFIEVTVSNS